ncbi:MULTISPECIES: GDSL-type esterase/lipase family protein [Clostridium]|uniref:GDSL family lipase n=1 Tax=Clostridium beijerinckii TaxID=1520 RepID=A0A1S8SD38_CLOBE|nr:MULTISPECIES: GDSL-type esterase/lipase family protein [Clostridium]MBN7574648.1 GDSL family lipase [Clostridium beijerinckii]MBN7580028.1 GDSL family lipase [Clostridium beijerinckii]MBN7584413.1 GDSL family lipase [Clostridium beijerinckii]MBO0522948.1 GDSL family lipase [Clostridium beijerinckii]MZK52896.1 GDSL family lipase [Clostridium beijerinckii]
MNNKLDIIFFGDSLTLGYGVTKQNSWVYKLTQERSLSSLNKACNGDTTTSMLTRYNDDVLIYSPSKIFIMGGSNDLLLGRKIPFIISNIEIMINDGLNIGSKVTLGIPPKIIGQMANSLFSPSHLYSYAEKELPYLKDELINLSNKYNLQFINFYDLTFNRDDIYLDGIHMNSLGHHLMYENALHYF